MNILLVLLLAAKPGIDVTVTPRLALHPQRLHYMARLTGPELEKFYCPEAVWTFSNGTQSTHQPDCPPWESRDDYQRTWRLEGRAESEGLYEVCFELRKAGKRITSGCASAEIR